MTEKRRNGNTDASVAQALATKAKTRKTEKETSQGFLEDEGVLAAFETFKRYRQTRFAPEAANPPQWEGELNRFLDQKKVLGKPRERALQMLIEQWNKDHGIDTRSERIQTDED